MNSEPKPIGWIPLTVLGVVVHVTLGAGIVARLLSSVPHWEKQSREFNMQLPSLTQQVRDASAWLWEGSSAAIWVLGGLILFDTIVLAVLARWERPLWKWWFWGVTVLLLLLFAFVVLAYQLPAWKLREGLSR